MYNYKYYDDLIIQKEDFEKFNEDEIKQYILDYVDKDDWLSKRVNNTFKSKSWLAEYISKDDLKQEIYLRVFNGSTMRGFMSRDTLGRIKYLNAIFSNTIIDVVRKNCKQIYVPLTEDMEIVSNYTSNETLWIRELFIENALTKIVFDKLEEGLTREEILEKLEISGRKFDAIKKEIKQTIKENE